VWPRRLRALGGRSFSAAARCTTASVAWRAQSETHHWHQAKPDHIIAGGYKEYRKKIRTSRGARGQFCWSHVTARFCHQLSSRALDPRKGGSFAVARGWSSLHHRKKKRWLAIDGAKSDKLSLDPDHSSGRTQDSLY
jgi:hypothetical protein